MNMLKIFPGSLVGAHNAGRPMILLDNVNVNDVVVPGPVKAPGPVVELGNQESRIRALEVRVAQSLKIGDRITLAESPFDGRTWWQRIAPNWLGGKADPTKIKTMVVVAVG